MTIYVKCTFINTGASIDAGIYQNIMAEYKRSDFRRYRLYGKYSLRSRKLCDEDDELAKAFLYSELGLQDPRQYCEDGFVSSKPKEDSWMSVYNLVKRGAPDGLINYLYPHHALSLPAIRENVEWDDSQGSSQHWCITLHNFDRIPAARRAFWRHGLQDLGLNNDILFVRYNVCRGIMNISLHCSSKLKAEYVRELIRKTVTGSEEDSYDLYQTNRYHYWYEKGNGCPTEAGTYGEWGKHRPMPYRHPVLGNDST